MAKTNIKHGSGSDIRSPVYAELGSLRRKVKGLGRRNPIRGEKQRHRSR